LANKVAEYILAGLPVITSDFPEPKKIISKYNCGWTVEVDKQAIIDSINSISKEDIKEKRNNALNCRYHFSWENEEKKLLEAYRNLLA
jgi:glycosyltransferase involved in cell wall biosynthesis